MSTGKPPTKDTLTENAPTDGIPTLEQFDELERIVTRKVESLQKQLDQVTDRLGGLEKQAYSENRDTIDELKREIAKLKRRLEAAEDHVREAKAEAQRTSDDVLAIGQQLDETDHLVLGTIAALEDAGHIVLADVPDQLIEDLKVLRNEEIELSMGELDPEAMRELKEQMAQGGEINGHGPTGSSDLGSFDPEGGARWYDTPPGEGVYVIAPEFEKAKIRTIIPIGVSSSNPSGLAVRSKQPADRAIAVGAPEHEATMFYGPVPMPPDQTCDMGGNDTTSQFNSERES